MIDITYNVYEDSIGKDPDTHSSILNHYHYLLWNKKLPNGETFNLRKVIKHQYYLAYNDHLSEVLLSSDSIIHPFHYWKKMKPIIDQISPDEVLSFHQLGATIGGYIIFPAKKINNLPTMNAARGLHGKIRDRFDLTLECIRLWYDNQKSPLFDVINRYQDFFYLFIDFKGYVDFFLLNDLVSDDYTHINFWLPFENYDDYITVPRSKEEYIYYKDHVMLFVKLRNDRIAKFAMLNL